MIDSFFKIMQGFFFQAEDGIRDSVASRGLGDVYKRQTLFVIGVLLFFGGTSTRGFAFALFIGVIVGTYSSIFIATPIMSDLTGELEAKKAKKKSSFSRATS